jgi:hypothetical protein
MPFFFWLPIICLGALWSLWLEEVFERYESLTR